MQQFRFSLFLFAFLFLLNASPASAQIVSAEQPGTGAIIHMSERLRPAGEQYMIRALGKVGEAQTEWALIIRSTGATRDVQATLSGEPVPIQRLTTDEEVPQGMTTIYFTANDFYALAQAVSPRIHVGDATFELPDAVQQDMKLIFERIKGASAGG